MDFATHAFSSRAILFLLEHFLLCGQGQVLPSVPLRGILLPTFSVSFLVPSNFFLVSDKDTCVEKQIGKY